METYELVATVKVGFCDNAEEVIADLVQLLAYHNIVCSHDSFKGAQVGDSVCVVVKYNTDKAC